MLLAIYNHFRLTWRLTFDRRVHWLLKLFLVIIPTIYAFFPTPDDILPVVGYLDEAALIILSTVVFNALCPPQITAEHRRWIAGLTEDPAQVGVGVNLDQLRHPDETRDLALGFAITFGMLALGGMLAGLLGLMLMAIGYSMTQLTRASMLSNAIQVSSQQLPEIYQALKQAQAGLPPVKVTLVVTQNPVMNAFTFGHGEPYTIVLTSALVEKMTTEELQAVIGHELGHALLDHVRLVHLMSGPSGLFRLLFYRWSRSCEYSADACALQACQGRLEPVVSALLKLALGLPVEQINVQAFLEQIEGKSSHVGQAEMLSTHPFLNNRINRLVQLSQTSFVSTSMSVEAALA